MLQLPEPIAEEAANGRGGHDPPACLLTHHDDGALTALHRPKQPLTVLVPSHPIELKAMGNPAAEGINQGEGLGPNRGKGAG